MTHRYAEPGVVISFDEVEKTMTLNGEMRHASLTEFKPTKAFLWGIIAIIKKMDSLTIDITNLEYLNSSGQAILNMLVLELKRETTNTAIKVIGTRKFEWQEKFLHTTVQLWGNAHAPMTIEISE